MSYGLCLRLQQEVQQVFTIVGGATSSIFPQVEALLLGGDDFQEALSWIAYRKKPEQYHSFMDFFFCELFPKWKISCRRYYADKGPPLRDELSPDEVMEYNKKLLFALNIEHASFEPRRRRGFCYKNISNMI